MSPAMLLILLVPIAIILIVIGVVVGKGRRS